MPSTTTNRTDNNDVTTTTTTKADEAISTSIPQHAYVTTTTTTTAAAAFALQQQQQQQLLDQQHQQQQQDVYYNEPQHLQLLHQQQVSLMGTGGPVLPQQQQQQQYYPDVVDRSHIDNIGQQLQQQASRHYSVDQGIVATNPNLSMYQTPIIGNNNLPTIGPTTTTTTPMTTTTTPHDELQFLSSLEDQASRMLMEQLQQQQHYHRHHHHSLVESSTLSQPQQLNYPQHLPLQHQQQQQQRQNLFQQQQQQHPPDQQQQQQRMNELLLQEFLSSLAATTEGGGGLNNLDNISAQQQQQLIALLQQQQQQQSLQQQQQQQQMMMVNVPISSSSGNNQRYSNDNGQQLLQQQQQQQQLLLLQQQQQLLQSYPNNVNNSNKNIDEDDYNYHLQQQQQQQKQLEMMDGTQTVTTSASTATYSVQQQQQYPQPQQLLSPPPQEQQLSPSKLERHFVTIAHDGSILEATRTLTGYAPEVLLMTSIYDSLYDEDLPGYLCIKTQFWDKGQPDVEAFVRRRTIDGDWIWLASKVISYINEGDINAVIIEESLIPDDQIDIAQLLNRTTRIIAILIQAVEAAWLAKANVANSTKNTTPSSYNQSQSSDMNSLLQPQQYDEETAAYQAVLDAIQTNGMDVPESVEELQQLMQRTQQQNNNTSTESISTTTTATATTANNNATNNALPMQNESQSTTGNSSNQKLLDQQQGIPTGEQQHSNHLMPQEKAFDPNSVVESVRAGVRLDFGMVQLDEDEVRVIALVLAGRIRVDEVAPLVLTSYVMGYGMKGVIDQFPIESELNTPTGRISHSHSNTSVGQQHSYSRNDTTNRGESSALSPPFNIPPLTIIPPPISVLNLSYTYIGNIGIEMLTVALQQENSCLSTLDISFCGIDEKGVLILSRALLRRAKKKISPLKGLILSGNFLSARAASEIGSALSAYDNTSHKRVRKGTHHRTRVGQRRRGAGYDSNETESSDDDEEGFTGITRKRRKVGQKRPIDEQMSESPTTTTTSMDVSNKDDVGLQVLHVAHCSLTAEAVGRLLEGLGANCGIKELNLASNYFGVDGATALLKFLEPKQRGRGTKSVGTNMAGGGGSSGGAIFPHLDRLDVSNNKLGDEGTTQLTRAILMRSMIHLVDLKLSSNSIGSGGIETIMNKLLQHNLISLSLDNNTIGDQGCQLVAASLQSMPSLARLNLGFNHIGCRGITSLMRSLVTCKSMRYLGLSGNIVRISGAIALAFTLSQHPRLEELDVDNCCLGQAAQCHIVSGIISNRWVPMKRLKGFALGPPMVAIGALKPLAANLSNEECLRIRKDEQMKTILQWMETNRTVKNNSGLMDTNATTTTTTTEMNNTQFLTPDFVSRTNDVHGTPSQNAYLRLLGWLSYIPFDDDELSALQMYFYDQDLDGDRGSDGHINLKLRGDLLAALDEKAADEIREDIPDKEVDLAFSAGIDLEKLIVRPGKSPWTVFLNFEEDELLDEQKTDANVSVKVDQLEDTVAVPRSEEVNQEKSNATAMSDAESAVSLPGKERKSGRLKPRITMFPQFEQQLLGLKTSATEMLEQEDDPVQHEIILTQYAEASLTILRQLRYHCMNSGLDGWRQSGLTRKVLIVDDSMVTRKLVSRAFEKANFIVDTACNGAEGVEKLKTSLYDIAFMDIDMPVMNGFEATKRLREWEDVMRPGARQPICALTATYVDDFERSELMKFKDAGLDVMESKPCNIPRLFKVVDDVAPMFSDLSISVMQKEKSDQSLLSSNSGSTSL